MIERKQHGKQEGFTLTEILTVVAIVAILASILSSAFFRVRSSGRRATCISNLHQLGLAMEMYRADWSDQNPKDKLLGSPPKTERLAWILLAKYAKSKDIFKCPDDGIAQDQLGYIYRSGPRANGDKERTPLGLEPSSVTAYCMEHLTKKVVQGPFEFEDFEMDATKHYQGIFQFLRADASSHTADAKQVETWVSDGKDWYELSTVPQGVVTFIRTERFPGEPWPPEFQF